MKLKPAPQHKGRLIFESALVRIEGFWDENDPVGAGLNTRVWVRSCQAHPWTQVTICREIRLKIAIDDAVPELVLDCIVL